MDGRTLWAHQIDLQSFSSRVCSLTIYGALQSAVYVVVIIHHFKTTMSTSHCMYRSLWGWDLYNAKMGVIVRTFTCPPGHVVVRVIPRLGHFPGDLQTELGVLSFLHHCLYHHLGLACFSSICTLGLEMPLWVQGYSPINILAGWQLALHLADFVHLT